MIANDLEAVSDILNFEDDDGFAVATFQGSVQIFDIDAGILEQFHDIGEAARLIVDFYREHIGDARCETGVD